MAVMTRDADGIYLRFSSDSSESDESSSSEIEQQDSSTKSSLLLTILAAVAAIVSACGEREEHIRQKDFIQALQEKGEVDFFRVLRVTRATFNFALQLVIEKYGISPPGKMLPLGPTNSLFVTLWYLGHQVTYIQLSELFGFAQSTIHECVQKIIDVFVSVAGRFLRWPCGQEAMKVEAEFRQKAGLRSVIGAIDGCHIRIKAPSKSQADYLDRTLQNSVNLMAVCDARKKFTFINAGFPGSAHDSRVYKECDLYIHMITNPQHLFPSSEHYFVGDSAFPLDTYLIVPYRNTDHLTPYQARFNVNHPRTRVVIENAFAFLKGRFRKLKYIDADVERVQPIIVACCVMSCIMYGLLLLN